MIANLKNYEPATVEFVIPEQAREIFPAKLFDGADSEKEVMDIVVEHFSVLFPEGEMATRKMDDFEVAEIREEYCLKQENVLPKRLQELNEAIETAKRIKRDAEERYTSLLTEIRDLAAEVKAGVKDYNLSPVSTVRLALNGYYVFYSWVNGEFVLTKAERIPEWDKRSLWSQEDKNREAMKTLFGIDFPEVEKPTSDEEFEEDDEV